MKRKIKAIETEYNGTRYRSRLEARWAVVFDRCGWRYTYEPEGWDIDGKTYLPDFWVDQLKAYVAIKPRPCRQAMEKALAHDLSWQRLLFFAGEELLVFVGDPVRGQYVVHVPTVLSEKASRTIHVSEIYIPDEALLAAMAERFGERK